MTNVWLQEVFHRQSPAQSSFGELAQKLHLGGRSRDFIRREVPRTFSRGFLEMDVICYCTRVLSSYFYNVSNHREKTFKSNFEILKLYF